MKSKKRSVYKILGYDEDRCFEQKCKSAFECYYSEQKCKSAFECYYSEGLSADLDRAHGPECFCDLKFFSTQNIDRDMSTFRFSILATGEVQT